MIDPIKKAGARYPIQDLDLVIWERDPRFHMADNLYMVLGDVGPEDQRDYPQKRVAQISMALSAPQKFRGIAALSELIPISAFGLRTAPYPQIVEGKEVYQLLLVRDPSLPIIATYSNGKPAKWRKESFLDYLNYRTSPGPGFDDLVIQSVNRQLRKAA